MNEPLEKQMRDTIVYDKGCLGVVSNSSVFTWGKSSSPLADDTPREGIYDN